MLYMCYVYYEMAIVFLNIYLNMSSLCVCSNSHTLKITELFQTII